MSEGPEEDPGGPGGQESPRTPRRREDKELVKRMSLLAVTVDDGEEEEGSEVKDELLEFSFTGEVPPM